MAFHWLCCCTKETEDAFHHEQIPSSLNSVIPHSVGTITTSNISKLASTVVLASMRDKWLHSLNLHIANVQRTYDILDDIASCVVKNDLGCSDDLWFGKSSFSGKWKNLYHAVILQSRSFLTPAAMIFILNMHSFSPQAVQSINLHEYMQDCALSQIAAESTGFMHILRHKSLNDYDEQGFTPFQYAIQANTNYTVLRMLCDRGADVNLPIGIQGRVGTMLHLLVQTTLPTLDEKGDLIWLCEAILQGNLNPFIVDENGDTARMIAARRSTIALNNDALYWMLLGAENQFMDKLKKSSEQHINKMFHSVQCITHLAMHFLIGNEVCTEQASNLYETAILE